MGKDPLKLRQNREAPEEEGILLIVGSLYLITSDGSPAHSEYILANVCS
jgi:hypothetical protein